MDPSFNLYPIRVIFKLLTDYRLNYTLYQDEVFYHIFWIKEINENSYEELVNTILKFRAISPWEKYQTFTERLSVQDTLANSLHETTYLFGQLESAGIVTVFKGEEVGSLRQGGFGREEVPDFITPIELDKHKPTGIRTYKTEHIKLNDNLVSYISGLLKAYPYDEKPHNLLNTLGRVDYILHLYNFYPKELLSELGIKQDQIQKMLKLTQNIKKYSRNQEDGDCYRFENVLCDAFNEFDDVEASTIGGAGNTDVECLYLTIDEKFAIEAKSTHTKLGGINSGRLQLHREKINAKYTIIVAPYYKPSVERDIKNTVNVMITASSLSNYLYQSAIHHPEGISYKSLYDIIQQSLGTNITSKVNDFVAHHYGIGKNVI
jgi:type II restriction enzyme